MKKLKKVWEVFDKHFIHIFTILSLLNIWIEPSLWVFANWIIYAGYRSYGLLEELVKNSRMSVNMQIKEYLKNNGYTEDKGGVKNER